MAQFRLSVWGWCLSSVSLNGLYVLSTSPRPPTHTVVATITADAVRYSPPPTPPTPLLPPPPPTLRCSPRRAGPRLSRCTRGSTRRVSIRGHGPSTLTSAWHLCMVRSIPKLSACFRPSPNSVGLQPCNGGSLNLRTNPSTLQLYTPSTTLNRSTYTHLLTHSLTHLLIPLTAHITAHQTATPI